MWPLLLVAVAAGAWLFGYWTGARDAYELTDGRVPRWWSPRMAERARRNGLLGGEGEP